MGMFDRVDVVVRCPKCNTKVEGFQSKDGPCELLMLPLARVDNLYAKCPNEDCGMWLEFERRYPDTNEILPGFDLITREWAGKSIGGESE